MGAFQFAVVLFEGCPGRAGAQRRHVSRWNVGRAGGVLALTGRDYHVGQLALRMTALLDSMHAIRSFHDLLKDAAPSSWSLSASASMSMPAFVKDLNTCSQAPPSRASVAATSPCCAKALSVPSGMVLTVKGAASAFT